MKNNIILRLVHAAAFLVPFALSGQNLDPTVEVVRTYEGKLMEVDKPQLEMAVPDSVLHFDLEFDYTVTDKPYKGSYEFSPYTVGMKPSPTVHNVNSFYLRAGAGYQLHPELDLIWSPETGRAFRMNVFAGHRSFIGNYLNLFEPSFGDGVVVPGRKNSDDSAARTWSGYDFRSRAGVEGRLDWKKGMLTFMAGWHGLQQKDAVMDKLARSYNAFDVKAGLASKKRTGFLYTIDAGYTYSGDALQPAMADADRMRMRASEMELDASMGFVSRKGDGYMVDIGVNTALMSGAGHHYNGSDFDIVPHYVRDAGRWRFDVGLRFSAAMSTSRFTDTYGVESLPLYPDVRIEYKLVRNALKLYAETKGDSKLNSYSDLLAFNRFVNPEYCRIPWELMDVSEEKINAAVGAEGRIGPRFSFELKGGYVKYEDVLMDGIFMTSERAPGGAPVRLKPALGYGSYDRAYASLGWLLDTESLRFDGVMEYSYSMVKKPGKAMGLFLPSAFRGDVALTYDWRDRIFVGLDCEFSTDREGSVAYPDSGSRYDLKSMTSRIPGYADLGVSFDYALNRKMSVWARGGNLLGMTIQRNVLYAEKGPYFTLGICLNL